MTDPLDPGLTPEALAEVAVADPSRWDEILEHPAVYPDLVQWITDARALDEASALEVDEASTGTDVALIVDPFAVAAEAHDPETDDEVGAEPLPSAADRERGPSRAPAVLVGVAIGVIVGATVSAALILVVLPGLFGGGIG